MLEESSTSYLGPGCREFESRHSDQKCRNGFCHSCFFLLTVRLEQSNAARMSAAGEGGAPRSESQIFMIAGGNHSIIHLTEPLLYLRTLPCADAFESRHSVRNRRFSVRNRRFYVSILSIQHLGSHQRHPLPLLYPIFSKFHHRFAGIILLYFIVAICILL